MHGSISCYEAALLRRYRLANSGFRLRKTFCLAASLRSRLTVKATVQKAPAPSSVISILASCILITSFLRGSARAIFAVWHPLQGPAGVALSLSGAARLDRTATPDDRLAAHCQTASCFKQQGYQSHSQVATPGCVSSSTACISVFCFVFLVLILSHTLSIYTPTPHTTPSGTYLTTPAILTTLTQLSSGGSVVRMGGGAYVARVYALCTGGGLFYLGWGSIHLPLLGSHICAYIHHSSLFCLPVGARLSPERAIANAPGVRAPHPAMTPALYLAPHHWSKLKREIRRTLGSYLLTEGQAL